MQIARRSRAVPGILEPRHFRGRAAHARNYAIDPAESKHEFNRGERLGPGKAMLSAKKTPAQINAILDQAGARDEATGRAIGRRSDTPLGSSPGSGRENDEALA